MVIVRCNNCGQLMDMFEEDSRQEWYEAIYRCDDCGSIKTHTQQFNQDGTILFEEIV